jgi:type IV pilus assembly protein PilC
MPACSRRWSSACCAWARTPAQLDTALSNVSYFLQSRRQGVHRKGTSHDRTGMTVLIGVILGWVMLAVLGPIYDIITKMKI